MQRIDTGCARATGPLAPVSLEWNRASLANVALS
jgi:hypothetical protein